MKSLVLLSLAVMVIGVPLVYEIGNLRHVQLKVQGHVFSFAYDMARKELTPMSDLTVKEFPELVPPGDRLVPAPYGGRVGEDSFLLPASWQTR